MVVLTMIPPALGSGGDVASGDMLRAPISVGELRPLVRTPLPPSMTARWCRWLGWLKTFCPAVSSSSLTLDPAALRTVLVVTPPVLWWWWWCGLSWYCCLKTSSSSESLLGDDLWWCADVWLETTAPPPGAARCEDGARFLWDLRLM